MKKKFCLYTDLLVKLGNMSNEELGELFRAILSYANGGEVSITSPTVGIAFSFIKIDLDAFQEEYEAKCRRAVENGKKGGRPKTEENLNNRVGFLENQTEPKKAERIGKDRIGNINKTYMAKTFEYFWDSYPKKVAKQSALKVWMKLKPNDELVDTIIKAVERQKRSETWKKDGGQFIPHPATWLNGHRWEDEVATKSRGYQGNDTDIDDILKGLSYEEL